MAQARKSAREAVALQKVMLVKHIKFSSRSMVGKKSPFCTPVKKFSSVKKSSRMLKHSSSSSPLKKVNRSMHVINHQPSPPGCTGTVDKLVSPEQKLSRGSKIIQDLPASSPGCSGTVGKLVSPEQKLSRGSKIIQDLPASSPGCSGTVGKLVSPEQKLSRGSKIIQDLSASSPGCSGTVGKLVSPEQKLSRASTTVEALQASSPVDISSKRSLNTVDIYPYSSAVAKSIRSLYFSLVIKCLIVLMA